MPRISVALELKPLKQLFTVHCILVCLETPESLLWLAMYNKSSFSFDKLESIKRAFVYVFPDLSKIRHLPSKRMKPKPKEYEAVYLEHVLYFQRTYWSKEAPERDKSEGNIADYLIRQDWRLFRKGIPWNNHHPA
ncbi:MAG: hypothetical protein IPI15_19400 [Saprospiraceae bacterium]|uniref:hypothetical protein n=1 Tax=Candidatus Brachybacter algidus TaxID=2982024 RepID=UPI002580CBFE|nr:hypothetical protein [Candidatus Brachybacter algidus]MBK7605683.1 hypothetical protein [Candidatus Brachybacter algidus]